MTQETEKTKEMYGFNRKETAEMANRCLLATAARRARRPLRANLLRRPGASGTPTPTSKGNHTKLLHPRSDQPTAALPERPEAARLLDDTLVIWGGEFGRTPMTEGTNGRDHNPYGFSMLMAGGGVKGGYVHGTTDEFGLYGVDNRGTFTTSTRPFCTSLGFDHTKLTFRHNGRDERLTDAEGQRGEGNPGVQIEAGGQRIALSFLLDKHQQDTMRTELRPSAIS